MDFNYQLQQIATNFIYKVYAWMTAALSITAITAYVVSQTTLSMKILSSPMIFLGLFILQLLIVIVLSLFIEKLSFTTALIAFFVYSILTGITLSIIFLRFTEASIAATFIIAAGMFATMAIYGYYTKSDLTSLGSFMYMLLWGLIIGGVVNIFLKSSAFQFGLSVLGVIVFTVLTAFDVQKIKELTYQMVNAGHIETKVAIIGALSLYLDFINLFLSLLNLTGKSRD